MTRDELLNLVDAHLTCLSIKLIRPGSGFRLISEMGQDVTLEFDGFMQAFLREHEKSPYQPVATEIVTAEKFHICVVEDSEDLIEELLDSLRGSGFQVSGFANGQAAWDALPHSPFDLVLTDIEMPQMTGLELLAAMRTSGMNIPVILMSAGASYGRDGRYTRAGAVDFFLKPFSMIELKERISEVLIERKC